MRVFLLFIGRLSLFGMTENQDVYLEVLRRSIEADVFLTDEAQAASALWGGHER